MYNNFDEIEEFWIELFIVSRTRPHIKYNTEQIANTFLSKLSLVH